MASGETLLIFTPLHDEPPASAFATLDLRNAHPVLDFDATTDEEAVFTGVLPRHYGGGGIVVALHWLATSATSGSCRWQAAFERMAQGGDDLDADSFASFQSAGGSANGTSGKVTVTEIAFSAGSAMDSVDLGEAFRLKVRRDADQTTGTDDMTGDAELMAVEVKEA